MEMVSGTETPLESLRWSRGARMAWQVRRVAGVVRVDGQSDGERVQIESALPHQVSRALLGSTCLYQMSGAGACA